MRRQAAEELRPGSPIGFPFLSLSQEIQLRVLEHTDLATPSRHVIWDPQRKFHLPPDDKRSSWQAPTPLFLVSWSVCEMAREVFWKCNHFETDFHSQSAYGYTKPGEPSTIPRRFSASEFLSSAVPIKFLRNIPSLDLRWFGLVEEKNTETATEDWFHILGDIKTGGGMHLDFLRIDKFRYVDPADAVWKDDSNEATIQNMRAFVHTHLWPLPGCNNPPAFTRQLLAGIRSDTTELIYSIRQGTERVPSIYYINDLGLIRATQSFSWQWGKHVEEEHSWYNEAQDGDWIETVWAKPRSPRLEY